MPGALSYKPITWSKPEQGAKAEKLPVPIKIPDSLLPDLLKAPRLTSATPAPSDDSEFKNENDDVDMDATIAAGSVPPPDIPRHSNDTPPSDGQDNTAISRVVEALQWVSCDVKGLQAMVNSSDVSARTMSKILDEIRITIGAHTTALNEQAESLRSLNHRVEEISTFLKNHPLQGDAQLLPISSTPSTMGKLLVDPDQLGSFNLDTSLIDRQPSLSSANLPSNSNNADGSGGATGGSATLLTSS